MTDFPDDEAGTEANADADRERYATFPEQPFCECGYCHLEPLPAAAWAVAGEGDVDRIAVLPGHEVRYENPQHVIERFDGWIAVSDPL